MAEATIDDGSGATRAASRASGSGTPSLHDVLGVLAAILLLALVGWRLGISPAEAARAGGLLAALLLPVGYLLLARSALAPADRLIVAGLLGLPVSAAAFYGLSLLHLGRSFPYLMLGAVIERAIAALRRPRRQPAGIGLNGPVLALAAAVLLAAFYDRRPFQPVTQGLTYRYLHRDDLIHQSFLWELVRGIPPRELPEAAGLAFPPYHILPYMAGVLLHRYAQISMPMVHHAMLPLLHLALFCGAAYLALRTLTGSPVVAGTALAWLFFVSQGLTRWRGHFAAGGFDLFRAGETDSGGLLIAASVLCLLALYDHARQQGEPATPFLWLSAVLVGLAYFFKAQMFLFLGPAYVLALLALGVVRRDSRLPRAVALAAGVTGLVFLSWHATTHFGPLAFAPGRLAAEMGEPRFRRFPFGLGFIPASVMAWWIRLNRPVLLPLYLVYRLRAPRRLSLAEAVLGSTLVGTLVMVSGLIVAELYQGEVGTMAVREATGLAWPLVTLGEIAVLGAALRSVWNGAERVLLGLTLALGVWLGPRLFATETATLTMSAGEAGAIAYLRERTPLESVVIEDHGSGIHEGLYLNRLPIVSALAGRRCVLEYVRRNIDTLHNRRKDILKLFSTDDPEIAQRILELYRVDYVLEYQATPLHFSSPLLRRVYDGGDVRVYAYLGE